MARIIITPPEEYRVVIAGRPPSPSITASRASTKRKRDEEEEEEKEAEIEISDSEPERIATRERAEQGPSRKRQRTSDTDDEASSSTPENDFASVDRNPFEPPQPPKTKAKTRAKGKGKGKGKGKTAPKPRPQPRPTPIVPRPPPLTPTEQALKRETDFIVRKSGGIAPELSAASNLDVAADLLDIFPGDEEAARGAYEGRGAKRAFAMAGRASAREERQRLREVARGEMMGRGNGNDAAVSGAGKASAPAGLTRDRDSASGSTSAVAAETASPEDGEARPSRIITLKLRGPKKPSASDKRGRGAKRAATRSPSPLTETAKVTKKTKTRTSKASKAEKAKALQNAVDKEPSRAPTEFAAIARELHCRMSTALAGFQPDKENEATEYDLPNEGGIGRAEERAAQRQGRTPLAPVNDAGPHRDRFTRDRDRPITGKRKRSDQVEAPKPKFQRLILKLGPRNP